MIERILILGVLVVVGVIAYQLITRRQLQVAAVAVVTDPLLNNVPLNKQTIVYFTTPHCAPCKLQQTPTLNKLETASDGQLQVIRVDATEDPSAAERWGVFSVPTTFVLDETGKPKRVFNGVVSEDQLKQELKFTS